MDSRDTDLVAEQVARDLSRQGAPRYTRDLRELFSHTNTFGAISEMGTWLRQPENSHPVDPHVILFGQGALLGLFIHSTLLSPERDKVLSNYFYGLAQEITDQPEVKNASMELTRRFYLKDNLQALGYIGLKSLKDHNPHLRVVQTAAKHLASTKTREIALETGYGIVRYADNNLGLDHPTINDIKQNIQMVRSLEQLSSSE